MTCFLIFLEVLAGALAFSAAFAFFPGPFFALAASSSSSESESSSDAPSSSELESISPLFYASLSAFSSS